MSGSPPPASAGAPAPRERSGRAATLVATGILLSRLAGLVRQHFLARYLGLSDAADAFNAAFRIPNFLQNLFGEGVLSASFIPVYARLRASGEEDEAARVASAVLSLLAVATSVLVLLGIAATPLLIAVIAPGFSGAKRELTITLVRILFPGAGLLVLSAWCLGVLNSHRRFLISYSAPIVWNIAIIAALVWRGGRVPEFDLAIVAAWASVVGSAAQLLVQVPTVLTLLHHFNVTWDTASANVRTIVSNFLPVFVGRGVVQISGYIDAVIASLLGTGALAALTNAQALYMLPVSLFGMSVSAAELPAMSSAVGEKGEVAEYLRSRLEGGLRRIAFLVIPSAMAFLALGRHSRGRALQIGTIHAGRLGVRVEHPRRLGRGAARVDARPTLRVDVLRAARHAHSASLRDRARRAHQRARIPVRDSAPEAARHRRALGRGGAHRVRGNRGMGGVRAAAPHAERAHRAHWLAGIAGRATLALGGGRGGRSVGREGARRPATGDSARGADDRAVRRGVFWRDRCAGHSRGAHDARATRATNAGVVEAVGASSAWRRMRTLERVRGYKRSRRATTVTRYLYIVPIEPAEQIALKLPHLPESPGVYLFKDASGVVLYVGKAKRLRSRVRSYFGADPLATAKTRVLVRQIADVETIVLPTEAHALVLEANLIKEYKPRFNIALRDDKSYPYIKVTINEPFPRVYVTRRLIDDGGRYFGPYTDVGAMRRALNVVKRIFTVRSCRYDMPKEMPERACLDYHIGRCKAPVHPAPDAGRVSGDDRRGAAVSRWSRGGGDEACARANG